MSIGSRSLHLRIHDVLGGGKIGITASSLAEVKQRASDNFGLTPDTLRIFKKDWTEVRSEEYFLALPNDTELVLIGSKRGEWITGTPGSP